MHAFRESVVLKMYVCVSLCVHELVGAKEDTRTALTARRHTVLVLDLNLYVLYKHVGAIIIQLWSRQVDRAH